MTRQQARALVFALTAVFALVLVRTAWLCDDAYINFRTIDNFLHGYGLRWNIAERVQTFTDPLWVFVIAAVVAVTREYYYTVIALSLILSVATASLVAQRVASDMTAAIVGLVLMIGSRAFVDFSTSGLEGPLTHVLLVLFFITYWKSAADDSARLRVLALLAALILLTRIDAALLVAPSMLVAVRGHGLKRAVAAIAPAAVMVAAWEVFALIYYGFPLPNTAYAKLGGAVSAAELAIQGFLYLLDSIALDPLTLVVIGTAIVATWVSGRRRDWPIAAGVLLSVAYVIAVGGDFMSGRFLAAPFVCAVMLLVTRPEWASQPAWVVSAALVAVIAVTGSPRSSVLTDGRLRHDFTDRDGILDERRVYYPFTGLMSVAREDGVLTHPWAQHARDVLASGEHVSEYIADGFFGFTLGPSVHAVDSFALGDPLLARLPAEPDWRPGHFGRRIPDGYEATLASGVNQIGDLPIADFYQHLQIVTRGPVWEWHRFREIWRLNTGAYRSLIDSSTYGLRHIPATELATRRIEGSTTNAPGLLRVREGGIAVDFGHDVTGSIEISLDGNDDYRIVYSRNGRDVATDLIRARWPNTDGARGLAVYRLDSIGARAFDQIRVYPYRGFAPFSLGYLIAGS